VRRLFFILAGAGSALSAAGAQSATVTGQVVLRDDGQPLGYTTIAVLSQGTQQLAGENGSFALTLPAGEVRLRFKRIGFLPKDTALMVIPCRLPERSPHTSRSRPSVTSGHTQRGRGKKCVARPAPRVRFSPFHSRSGLRLVSRHTGRRPPTRH